jgi:flagellar hook-associated protein 1 FlgK
MRSTFSGLNTVVRGVYANQLSLDTVGHNITNANTEGYSRQRVNLVTTLPEVVYGGTGALQVGTGVAIESVTRARDIFMDRQYWKESSSLGYGETAVSTYSQIEDIFNDELPDIGLQTVLNNFWQSWQTLATNASNDSARTAVRERGAELVNAIKHGNKYDSKKTVRVVSQIDENEASFIITDEGPGFHLEEVPDPTADENLERPCGRGLMLIRAFMDEVSYNKTGNEVRLVKRRTRQESK